MRDWRGSGDRRDEATLRGNNGVQALQQETFHSQAVLLPARWAERVERVVATLGISLEIWSAPGHHGQRLHLGSVCRACKRQEPRTFDRCRKRRAYLTRPEAPVPETLAEKCPQQVRLARSGGDHARREPVLFAFGYEAHGDAGRTDAAILSFLQDLGQVMGGRSQGDRAAILREIGGFVDAAHDALPEGPIVSMADGTGGVTDWLHTCRRSLEARVAFLWPRDEPMGFLSTAAPESPQLRESCMELSRNMTSAMVGNEGKTQMLRLDLEKPILRSFGEDLECRALSVPLSDTQEGLLLLLHAPGSGEHEEALEQRIQDLLSLWKTQLSLRHSARRAQEVLSDTLLALATEQEGQERRGRTRRVRCLTMLLAQELRLHPDERLALHWACLLRGGGTEVHGESDPASNPGASMQPLVQALTSKDSPLDAACARVLERANALRDSGRVPSGVEGPADLTADCLVVAEAFDDLLARGGSTRPRSIRAAVAFLEAGAGIAFDPVVVRALGALEAALVRHPWIFLLGHQPS